MTMRLNYTPFGEYLIHLADTALVLGHRNSEWTGHGPVLEQDIALSNIALDLIGQCRNLYQYASVILAPNNTEPIDEDRLAYFRDSREYRNCILVELPNGHWGKTVLKQLFVSAWQYGLYSELMKSKDQQLAGIAEKSLKEVSYHLRWSSEWVIRLGDGTEESHNKMKSALEELWQFTGELFTPVRYELEVSNELGFDCRALEKTWQVKLTNVLMEARLLKYGTLPQDVWMQQGGKTGVHTEHLGYLLAEMQSVQRAYPGCEW